MKKQICSLILLVVLTSSCTIFHVSSTSTTKKAYPKKSTQDVVFIENIEQDYEIIGNVTINAERRQLLSEVIEKMKYEASLLGGDAITDIKTDATGVWKRLPAQKIIGNAHVRSNFTASVVVLQ